jgi:hypothetical protein
MKLSSTSKPATIEFMTRPKMLVGEEFTLSEGKNAT